MRRLVWMGVPLWPALCLITVNSCAPLCHLSCNDDYSSCLGGSPDPLLERHCEFGYSSCVESCGRYDDSDEDCDEDAGTPMDVSGAGLERD